MDWSHVLAYLAFGLAGGVVGGMLGVGGAIVIIPLATVLLAPGKDVLQGATMIANVAVALTAYRKYGRAGYVDWTFARPLVVPSLVAVGLGVGLSLVVDARMFRLLFAAFLFFVAAREFVQLVRGAAPMAEDPSGIPAGKASAIGALMGTISGLLGVGGGVVAVPLLRAWADLPVRRAITTSVCAMVPLAAVGAVLKGATLPRAAGPDGVSPLVQSLGIAACLAPAAIVGSWIGATLNLGSTVRAVRGVLGAWLQTSAAWMAWPVVKGWLDAAR
ncbi:MAG: TSUP family transporter [Phycisphaerales bacterium]